MGSSSKSKPTPGASGVILQTDTEKYRQKYKELKRKVREIEAQNDKLALKTLTVKRNIQRLRLERSILYERLEKNLHQNQLLDPSRASTQMGGSITGTNGNQLDSNRFDRFPPPPPPSHQSLQHPNQPQHHPQHQHQHQQPHDTKPQGTSLQLPSLPTNQPFAIPSNSRFSTADHPHAHGPSNPNSNPNPVESTNLGNPSSLQNQIEGQMEGNGASGSGNRMKITLKRSGP